MGREREFAVITMAVDETTRFNNSTYHGNVGAITESRSLDNHFVKLKDRVFRKEEDVADTVDYVSSSFGECLHHSCGNLRDSIRSIEKFDFFKFLSHL